MTVLVCFEVNTSEFEVVRVHVALKKTAWIGLVKSVGGTKPIVPGTTGEVSSNTDTNPAAGSLKNGRRGPSAASESGSPSWAEAGATVIHSRHATSTTIENRIDFLTALPPVICSA